MMGLRCSSEGEFSGLWGSGALGSQTSKSTGTDPDLGGCLGVPNEGSVSGPNKGPGMWIV